MNPNSKKLITNPYPLISSYYWIYFVISLVFLLPGILSLALWRLKPGIDFTGGTILEFSTTDTRGESAIRSLIPKDVTVLDIHKTASTQYSLRVPSLTDAKRSELTSTLSATLKGYTERGLTSVGPSIGKELIIKTAIAIGLASLFIAVYLALRFKSYEYGIAAVIATLHDVLILLGVFSLLGRFGGIEVDTLFVTALLTVVSFSVHDTVVVYDRIRERKKKILREPMMETIDFAVLETLTRSLRNSLAVIIVLLALILLGGESLRWFGVALLVGTISGTYSSTFVALPLLVVIEKVKNSNFKRFKIQK